MPTVILLVAFAYLLGSVPCGWVVMKVYRNLDVRKLGSGNIGAANVFRAGGLEPRQAGDRTDRRDPGEIEMSEHAVFAAHRLLDSANSGMRERAAQERDLEHPRQLNVGDELAATAQETVVLLARQGRADPFATARGVLCGQGSCR